MTLDKAKRGFALIILSTIAIAILAILTIAIMYAIAAICVELFGTGEAAMKFAAFWWMLIIMLELAAIVAIVFNIIK